MPVIYLSLPEAASSLGLATSTLRHQIRNRKIVAVKVGGRWFVTPDEVQRYRQVTLKGEAA